MIKMHYIHVFTNKFEIFFLKKILGHAGHVVDLVNSKNILPLLPCPVLPCD